MKNIDSKILLAIPLLAFLSCLFFIVTDHGGSAFGNILDTLRITSFVLFIYCIILLIISFKKNIKRIRIWFVLLISSPFAIMLLLNKVNNLKLYLTDSTTPEQYQYNLKIDSEKYLRDKEKIEKQIDSLIKIRTIQKPSELALRYFNGKFYEDTIDRDKSINLPLDIKYRDIIIDTLFYSENPENVIAGLLINKVVNKYRSKPGDSIDFVGKAFVYKSKSKKPIEILRYTFSGYDNYKNCSERLRFWYLKKLGTKENEYNLNDIRFLNKIWTNWPVANKELR